MNFKKAFFIGYIVFLLILASIYFLMPPEHMWTANVILCLLFFSYQIMIGFRVKEK